MQNVCGFYFCTLFIILFSSLLVRINKDLHGSSSLCQAVAYITVHVLRENCVIFLFNLLFILIHWLLIYSIIDKATSIHFKTSLLKIDSHFAPFCAERDFPAFWWFYHIVNCLDQCARRSKIWRKEVCLWYIQYTRHLVFCFSFILIPLCLYTLLTAFMQ